MDPESGALTMKKLEPMINTVSPALTYLLQCNTDVTSLKSGTAIKAVIMYVTDYITKSSLRTHVMFDIIRYTYQKNNELLGGTEARHEKARRLITKMVNNISANMETGSPMAAMYVLKNPDHYTDHDFAPFFWINYVMEARSAWQTSDNESHDYLCSEKVTLVKRNGRIIGLSGVYDYVFRPLELEHLCLYDWVRLCIREKARGCVSNTQNESELDNTDRTDDLEESAGIDMDADGSSVESDHESEGVPDDIQDRKVDSATPKGLFRFTKMHPLYKSHKLRCVGEDKARIPNFIGQTLPRRDQGDREWYCMTMLVLFVPWRSGLHLKGQLQSWDDAFLAHKFTERQMAIMDHFNLRYECMDACDDFHNQMKQSAIFPSWVNFPNSINDPSSSECLDDDAVCGVVAYEVDADVTDIGKREQRRRNESAIMNDIMRHTGWTEAKESRTINPASHPDIVKTGNQWKVQVKEMRQSILDKSQQAQCSIESGESQSLTVLCTTQDPNQVKVVDKSYLERGRQSTDHKPIIDSIVLKFMYPISLRLSKILNVTDLAFGGMNMVFDGDFAQLPPAIGQEHAALYSRTVGTKSTSLRDQECAVGKALWHQVTTVVILRDKRLKQRMMLH